jgi:hypothetical protein
MWEGWRKQMRGDGLERREDKSDWWLSNVSKHFLLIRSVKSLQDASDLSLIASVSCISHKSWNTRNLLFSGSKPVGSSGLQYRVLVKWLQKRAILNWCVRSVMLWCGKSAKLDPSTQSYVVCGESRRWWKHCEESVIAFNDQGAIEHLWPTILQAAHVINLSRLSDSVSFPVYGVCCVRIGRCNIFWIPIWIMMLLSWNVGSLKSPMASSCQKQIKQRALATWYDWGISAIVDHMSLTKSGKREESNVGSRLYRRAPTMAMDHPRRGEHWKELSGPDRGSRNGRNGW